MGYNQSTMKFRRGFIICASSILLAATTATASVAIATSCHEESQPNITSVYITLNNSSIKEGDTVKAYAKVNPSTLTGVTFEWSIWNSNTKINFRGSEATFTADKNDNGKDLKVVATYNGHSASYSTKLKISPLSQPEQPGPVIPPDPSQPELPPQPPQPQPEPEQPTPPPPPTVDKITGVELKIQSGADNQFVGTSIDFIAAVTPSTTKNIKYEWMLDNEVIATTNDRTNFYTLNLELPMNGKKFSVKVTQTLPAPQAPVVIVSRDVPITVIEPGGGSEEINWPALISQEKTKWLNTKFGTLDITQEEFDNMAVDTMPLENFFRTYDLLDDEHFSYEYAILSSEANTYNINTTIYPADFNIAEDQVEVSFKYNITNSTGPSVGNADIEKAITDLNNTNWNDFNYAKWQTQTQNRFLDIDKNNLLTLINNFDRRQFEINHNDVSISIGTFIKDVLQQTIRFTLNVSKDGTQATSNEFTINYKTPDALLNVLDRAEVEPGVNVAHSYKGVVSNIGTLPQLNTGLFEDRFDKAFNSASAETAKQMKIYEMLYQARFILYQTFADNATSIDYGTDASGNVVVLKAKIKDSVTVPNSLVQIAGTSSSGGYSLTAGKILTITLAPSDWSFKWQTISNDDTLGGGLFTTRFMYGQGPETNKITDPSKQFLSFGTSWGDWSYSITQDNANIFGGSLSKRASFNFTIPCIKKQ